MKTIRIKILAIVILTIGFSSCRDKFFNQIRPVEPIASNTRTFEQILTEAYLQTFWSVTSGLDLCYDLTVSSAVQVAGPNAGMAMDNQFRHLYSATEIAQGGGPWTAMYRAIFWCNYGLDLDAKGKGNPFNLDVTSDDYLKNYRRQIGELYFIRAYCYYSIARWYAPPYNDANKGLPGIVLVTDPTLTQDAVNNLKLGTVDQIYAQIISDFTMAETILPEQLQNATWNNYSYFQCGRANKYVAKAFLGKVYFLMGNYDQALPRFNDVIGATQYYSLSTDVTIPFTNIDRNNRNPENILEYYTGDSYNGSANRGSAWTLFYAMQTFGYRLPLSAFGGGNNLINADGSPLVSLNLSNGINPQYVSYFYLRMMEWMEPDKGNTFVRDPAVSDLQLRTVSADTAITALAHQDARYVNLFHQTRGLKKGLIPPARTGTFPATKLFNAMYPDDASWNKGFFDCLRWDPDVNTARKPYTENSNVVYIDKYYRGLALRSYASNFTLFPLYRLAEVYLFRAQSKLYKGDKAGAAADLNVTWNRANPTNPNRFNAGNISDDTIWAEYLREMLGDGHLLEFAYATKRTIKKGDNPYPTVVDEPYPYSKMRFSFPQAELDVNKNIDQTNIY